MTALTRIGALDIADAISGRIGSYVHAELIQFLAVENERVHCWYMNSGGEGPSFDIQLQRSQQGWTLYLTELPPGTDFPIETPNGD